MCYVLCWRRVEVARSSSSRVTCLIRTLYIKQNSLSAPHILTLPGRGHPLAPLSRHLAANTNEPALRLERPRGCNARFKDALVTKETLRPAELSLCARAVIRGGGLIDASVSA